MKPAYKRLVITPETQGVAGSSHPSADLNDRRRGSEHGSWRPLLTVPSNAKADSSETSTSVD